MSSLPTGVAAANRRPVDAAVDPAGRAALDIIRALTGASIDHAILDPEDHENE